MGVTKEKTNVAPIRLEDHIQDYMLDSDDENEVQEGENGVTTITSLELKFASAPSSPRKRRGRGGSNSRICRLQAATIPESSFGTRRGRRQRPGVRKLRRQEHARLLTALVDPDDICDDFSDTLPETISAFTHLFLEKKNMEVWNKFIEKSETEQEFYLKNLKPEPLDSGSKGQVLGGKKVQDVGSRYAHPAYSGEACFRRIDSSVKNLLNHKHFPMGKLEQFEKELLDFFLTSPDGVWVSGLSNGFDRLLLHAVAQYMSLKSKSFDTAEGSRKTQVENPKPFFVPPREKLVDYLQGLQQAKS